MLPILIPATLFFTIYYLRRHSIADAVVNVYLLVFLLIPSFYGFRIPHLPGLNFGEAALIPIVIALLARHGREWKFSRADIWMILFFGGAYYSELSHSGSAPAGLIGITDVLEGVLPYILGKMLLEQDGVRERFCRRYVYICFFVAVVSVWEFRMGRDLFITLESTLFSQPDFGGQFRGGFIRIAGSFGGSIQAGTVLSIAWLMSMWLGVLDKSRGNERKHWGLRQSTILSLGIAGGLIMTLSRGPIIGTIVAYFIARVGKAKNMGRTAVITTVLLAVVGTIGVIQLKQYTSGSLFAAKTQEQMNAIYRRLLLDEYKPYIEKGGFFGYGVVDRPVVPGMFSIDNAFLNIQLLQGNLGLWTLMLLGFEALLAAFLAAYRSAQRVDIYFALCMAGGMAGFLLAMTSVWLGPPMFQLFFLLVGWSQSLRETQVAGEMLPLPANSRFSFRRVIA